MVVAINDSVGYTYIPDIASTGFRWVDNADLTDKILALAVDDRENVTAGKID